MEAIADPLMLLSPLARSHDPTCGDKVNKTRAQLWEEMEAGASILLSVLHTPAPG